MTENTATQERITYWIATSNMERLNKEIAKLNKRADKIGCPPVEVVILGTRLIPDPNKLSAMEIARVEQGMRPISQAEKDELPQIEQTEVEIVGEGPKIEGWKFVGTLDHYTLPGKVLVNAVPGETVPPQYFEIPADCDHCNKIRRRIETFVLEGVDENEGEFKMVGRNCLRDFFGHDPQAVARWLTRLITFVGSLEDEDEGWGSGGGGRYETYFDAVKALSNTIACIRSFGWVARSNADEENIPTVSHVFYIMSPPYNAKEREQKRLFMQRVKFEDTDTAEAEEAIAWLKTQEGNNEYMHNLKLLEDQEAVPSKMMGYWCSLAAAYQREQDRLERAKRTKKLNEYYGEIKDRIELEVKCVGINYIDSYYGTVCIHRMLSAEGHTLIWFANADAKMKKGGQYKMRATVKKHEEYKDWKQTQVSRLMVLEEIDQEENE
jgi:hypothetical protein